MEIRSLKGALLYEGLYSKPIRTTLNNEPDSYDLIQYVYQLTYRDENESIVIRFATEVCDLIPKWMCHHFSDQKQRKVSPIHPEVMSSLLRDSGNQLKKNIDRLREGFKHDISDGLNKLIIDEELNSQNNFTNIQILDLQIRDSDDTLTYQKVGVYDLIDERPMKTSQYRHLLEWFPLENKIKLINIGIRQSKHPYPLFELNYSEHHEKVDIKTDVDIKILDVWIPYIMPFKIDSTKVMKLLSDKILRKANSNI